MAEMTKGERAELRTAVRLQFKVLRSDVFQRRAEVVESLVEEIDKDYERDFENEQRTVSQVRTIAENAAIEARKVIEANGLFLKDGAGSIIQANLGSGFAERKRISVTRKAERSVDSQVAKALAELDRQEATMLRQLTLDGIESDAARKFFDGIPTVSALVPMSRLAELEASFGDDR
jgi:hypothetical protein